MLKVVPFITSSKGFWDKRLKTIALRHRALFSNYVDLVAIPLELRIKPCVLSNVLHVLEQLLRLGILAFENVGRTLIMKTQGNKVDLGDLSILDIDLAEHGVVHLIHGGALRRQFHSGPIQTEHRRDDQTPFDEQFSALR